MSDGLVRRWYSQILPARQKPRAKDTKDNRDNNEGKNGAEIGCFLVPGVLSWVFLALRLASRRARSRRTCTL